MLKHILKDYIFYKQKKLQEKKMNTSVYNKKI